MGVIRTAWTVFKLKLVTWVLGLLLRIHIWYELRNRNIGDIPIAEKDIDPREKD